MRLPKKRYGIIYADPPWPYREGTQQGWAGEHYKLMPLKELKALDVPSLAARDCALALWTTAPFLPAAISLIQSWGFKYVTCLVTWIKLVHGREPLGLGRYTRGPPEYLLLGRRGKVHSYVVRHDLRATLHAERGGHSEKPEAARALLSDLFPGLGPRIELFARRRVKGWDAWGLEAPASPTTEESTTEEPTTEEGIFS